jgi:ABC-type branched-subunit amino acid transport system permease subunit
VVFGALMIIFMIFQPLGMAKIWENIKLKFAPKSDRPLTS